MDSKTPITGPKEHVTSAIAQIADEQQRLIAELKYFGCRSDQEIADCLGTTADAVTRLWDVTLTELTRLMNKPQA